MLTLKKKKACYLFSQSKLALPLQSMSWLRHQKSVARYLHSPLGITPREQTCKWKQGAVCSAGLALEGPTRAEHRGPDLAPLKIRKEDSL